MSALFPPGVTIKPARVPRVNESIAFSGRQMAQVGETIRMTQLERTAQARNALDQPMAPLKPRYAQRKQRKGGRPVRDLRLTGKMLGGLVSRLDGDRAVVVSLEGADAKRKAWFRQLADSWLGLSRTDAEAVDGVVFGIHRENVRARLLERGRR